MPDTLPGLQYYQNGVGCWGVDHGLQAAGDEEGLHLAHLENPEVLPPEPAAALLPPGHLHARTHARTQPYSRVDLWR